MRLREASHAPRPETLVAVTVACVHILAGVHIEAQPSVLGEVAAVADQPVEAGRSGLWAATGRLMGVLAMVTPDTG